MAKEPQASRRRVTAQAVSKPAPVDSRPPGDGSIGTWVDQYGRQCIGNECFHVASDSERNEVRVVIDQDGPCGSLDPVALDSFVNEVKGIIAKDGTTVYQTRSKSA